MQDVLEIDSNVLLNASLEFSSVNSDWEQGIVLGTKGEFIINTQRITDKVILWEKTAPKLVDFQIKSTSGKLSVYNAWKLPNGTVHFWHNGGALFCVRNSDFFEYHCNDGYPDDDFDDLIFKLKIDSAKQNHQNV